MFFYSDQHQLLIKYILCGDTATIQIYWKSVQQFCVIVLTNQQTNKAKTTPLQRY